MYHLFTTILTVASLLAAGMSPSAIAFEDLPLGPENNRPGLHGQHKMKMQTEGYRKQLVNYRLPEVTLLDSQDNPVNLAALTDADRPLVINFIFTTCPTICPVLTSTFKGAEKGLMALNPSPLMISITIDPEHDTPGVLREYRRRHHAGPEWMFLTGPMDSILKVEKALDIYRGNKLSHEAVTLIKAPQKKGWLRLDGFTGTLALIKEYREFVGAHN